MLDWNRYYFNKYILLTRYDIDISYDSIIKCKIIYYELILK